MSAGRSSTTSVVCAARPPRSRKSATPTEDQPAEAGSSPGHGPRRASGPIPQYRSRPAVTAGEPPALTFAQHTLAFIKELFAVVIGAVLVASLLRAFVGQMFLIPSPSMEHTLSTGDRVVVEKLSSIKRGQIVVFQDPGGWLNATTYAKRGSIGQALQFVGILPDNSTEHLIKRVIGMPGDRVVCCDNQGRITVNSQPLDESAYLFVGADGVRADPSGIPFEVVVPDHRVFVLGDNRAHSRDSRCHLDEVKDGGAPGDNAFVSEDLVVGRAVAVVWPTSRAHRLPIPDTLEAVPPAIGPAPGTPQITAGPEANC